MLRTEVMYLPRKPCSAVGSLSDLLTYPVSLPSGLPREELRRWLRLVDLEHLVDEENAAAAADVECGLELADAAVDWGERLSLMDQQAFGFLRLLYQRPRFAVLDDCTSALDRLAERRLLEVAQELGITCVTLSRRPLCQEIHSHSMQLHGGELASGSRGWKLLEPPRDSGRSPREGRPRKTRCGSSTEAQARIEAYLALQAQLQEQASGSSSQPPPDPPMDPPPPLERRDEAAAATMAGTWSLASSPRTPHFGQTSQWGEGSSNQQQGLSLEPPNTIRALAQRRWPSRLGRLAEVLRLGLQTPARRRSALRQVATILALLQARAWLHWMFCRGLCGMVRASLLGDIHQVFAELLVNGIVVCANGFADQLMRHQAGHLAADAWSGSLGHLQRRLMKESVLLRVVCPTADSAVLPIGEDPVVRLAEVRGLFDSLSSQLCDSLMHLANLALLMPALLRGLGKAALLPLTAHIAAARGLQWLAPRLESMRARTAALERSFQAAHGRTHRSAEEVAFAGGGALERAAADLRLQAMLDHASGTRMREFMYRVLTTFVTDYRQLPTWIQRFVSFRFAQQTLLDSAGVGAASAADTLTAHLLFDWLIQAPHLALQHCTKVAEKVGRIDALCLRYLELLAACELTARLQQQPPTPQQTPSGQASPMSLSQPLHQPTCSQQIRVRDLDLRRGGSTDSSDEVPLAEGLTFEVEAEAPLLVTGPSESGKSLLGRVLLGLVPPSGLGASVAVGTSSSSRPPPQLLMAVPQAPYLAFGGRLVTQLAYPTVLRWPSRAPFEVRIENIGATSGISEAALLEHFRPLGAVGCRLLPPTAEGGGPSRGATRRAVVMFRALNEVLRAVARPQDRVIGGVALECELGESGGEVAGSQCLSHSGSQSLGTQPRLSRMRLCLRALGLERLLLDEAEGWFARRPWEELLSAGEQQRFCIARLLYHGPSFALLDDCTSALPVGKELEIHSQLLKSWGITPITLSPRAFAPDFYTRELQLCVQESPRLWKLDDRRAPSSSAADDVVDGGGGGGAGDSPLGAGRVAAFEEDVAMGSARLEEAVAASLDVEDVVECEE